MMRARWSALLPLFLLPACASSEPTEPAEPVPPTAELLQFDSTLITPDAIDFVGKVAITNHMRGPLQIEKVDYSADLHEQPYLSQSFTELRPMRSRGTQTVTLPIRVAMQQVVKQIDDVVSEESVRVTLHGTVYPVGFAPIPFTGTKVIPIPRLPRIALDGAQGNPLEGAFTVFLKVENKNPFPLDFTAIESFLTLNGKRHDLLKTESFQCVAPGGSGRIALTMRQTRSKGLGMLINVVQNQSAEFAVGGSIRCQTPHGLFLLPVEVSSSAASPGR